MSERDRISLSCPSVALVAVVVNVVVVVAVAVVFLSALPVAVVKDTVYLTILAPFSRLAHSLGPPLEAPPKRDSYSSCEQCSCEPAETPLALALAGLNNFHELPLVCGGGAKFQGEPA